MNNAIEQVFKVFNHLAREIQVYLFSGLVIAVNVLIIDYFYYNSTLLAFIRTNTLTIPAAIVLYLLGQFCMAFFYTILEWTNLDRKINKFLNFDYKVDSNSLPKIYEKNRELYLHFVERYIILIMMRWTISAACFINLIIDVIVLFKKDFHWQFLLTTIVFATGTITFYMLTARTENDYADRIESLQEEKEL
jgi:hypothetical protein